jgi:hypothetical protein
MATCCALNVWPVPGCWGPASHCHGAMGVVCMGHAAWHSKVRMFACNIMSNAWQHAVHSALYALHCTPCCCSASGAYPLRWSLVCWFLWLTLWPRACMSELLGRLGWAGWPSIWSHHVLGHTSVQMHRPQPGDKQLLYTCVQVHIPPRVGGALLEAVMVLG